MYVFIIKQPSKTDKIKRYLKAAELCQEQIKESGEVESFARRCTSVLEELHAEVNAKLGGSQVADARLGAQSPPNNGESEIQQQEQDRGYYESGNNLRAVDKIDRWGFWGLTGY